LKPKELEETNMAKTFESIVATWSLKFLGMLSQRVKLLFCRA